MNRFSLLLAIAVTTAAATAVVFNASPAAAATPPDVTPAKVAASRLGNGHAVYVRGGDGRLWWRTVEEFASRATRRRGGRYPGQRWAPVRTWCRSPARRCG